LMCWTNFLHGMKFWNIWLTECPSDRGCPRGSKYWSPAGFTSTCSISTLASSRPVTPSATDPYARSDRCHNLFQVGDGVCFEPHEVEK
jgi:hypothetical protein